MCASGMRQAVSGSGCCGALDAVQEAVAASTVGEVRYMMRAECEIGPDPLIGVRHGVPRLRPGDVDVVQGRVGGRHRELLECGALMLGSVHSDLAELQVAGAAGDQQV